MEWIDYKKAFDSVPHSWILAPLNMYRTHDATNRFVEYSMRYWKTELMLYHQSLIIIIIILIMIMMMTMTMMMMMMIIIVIIIITK